jgi:hypothetical protein
MVDFSGDAIVFGSEPDEFTRVVHGVQDRPNNATEYENR